MGKKIILVSVIIIIIILVWYYLIKPKSSNIINKNSLIPYNIHLTSSGTVPKSRG